MCRSYSFDLHEQLDWKLAEVRVHGGRDRRTEREKRSPARRHVEKANGASQALKRGRQGSGSSLLETLWTYSRYL